jgi:hypothetical protein
VFSVTPFVSERKGYIASLIYFGPAEKSVSIQLLRLSLPNGQNRLDLKQVQCPVFFKDIEGWRNFK